MSGNCGAGRRRLVGGLALLLALLAPPGPAGAQTGAGVSLALDPYVRFLYKWPEQVGAGGFPEIVVTDDDVQSGTQGIAVYKESRCYVSLLGNCWTNMSFPVITHWDGPGSGVDLTTAMFSTVMQTRPPQPLDQVGFTKVFGVRTSTSTFDPGLTYIGIMAAGAKRIWTTAGTYTGSVTVTIMPEV